MSDVMPRPETIDKAIAAMKSIIFAHRQGGGEKARDEQRLEIIRRAKITGIKQPKRAR